MKLYRYTAHWSEHAIGRLQTCEWGGDVIYLHQVPFLRHTPDGAWVEPVEHGAPEKKLIVWSWRKRYAHHTPEEALKAFEVRYRHHLRHLKARADRAQKLLDITQAGELMLYADMPKDLLGW